MNNIDRRPVANQHHEKLLYNNKQTTVK